MKSTLAHSLKCYHCLFGPVLLNYLVVRFRLIDPISSLGSFPSFKQAMIPLQEMAEHRFTSVYIYQCLFIGEIFFLPNFLFLFLLGPYLKRCMCTLLGTLPCKHVYLISDHKT